MAVFVCGDTHQTHDIYKLRRFNESHGAELTKDDYVIVCGDFGLLWSNPYTLNYYEEEGKTIPINPLDKYWNEEELDLLERYNNYPWTTLWVDGNHENFDRLETYPITEWRGGKVQKISDSVIHLLRGEIYEIDGETYFTFGGARSTDRGPAVGDEFESIHKWWWPQEISTEEEYLYAVENLAKVDNKVDYIITHDCPSGANPYGRDIHSARLEMIRQTVKFKHWYCGHMHVDTDVAGANVTILYNEILPIGETISSILAKLYEEKANEE